MFIHVLDIKKVQIIWDSGVSVMGCNYSRHEIDSCYVPAPIPDCNWIIAHRRGNPWKGFEGQKKGGIGE